MKKILSFESAIISCVAYFYFFDYPPTAEEIHFFLPIKIDEKEFFKKIKILVKTKWLIFQKTKDLNSEKTREVRYTLGEYSRKVILAGKRNTLRDLILTLWGSFSFFSYKYLQEKAKKRLKEKPERIFRRFEQRFILTKTKLTNKKLLLYLTILSKVPQIKLVGVSGSLSMANAKKNDDIDLFIITARNRLFTGRFLAIFLAKTLGIHRSRALGLKGKKKLLKDKVCLNLFFDEGSLVIPKIKRSIYVGHEALQMRPLIDKEGIYQRFLAKNKWLFQLFPNAKAIIKENKLNWVRSPIFNFEITDNFGFFYQAKKQKKESKIFGLKKPIFDKIEELLKNIQLRRIRLHYQGELLRKGQLWFHPIRKRKKNVSLEMQQDSRLDLLLSD